MMRDRHCQTLVLKEQVHALDERVKELLDREETAGRLQIQLQGQIAALERQLALQKEANVANNSQFRTRIVDLVSQLESERQINRDHQASQNGIDELLRIESEKRIRLEPQLTDLTLAYEAERSSAQLLRNRISLGTGFLFLAVAVALAYTLAY